MNTESVGEVKVQKQSGVVIVSLSKVVEISTNRLTVVCLDADDFELECLDSIFSPTPRDEILREMVLDIISESQDDSHVEGIFEIIDSISGEHITRIKREDYESWCDVYKKEFQNIVLDAIDKDMDNTNLSVEVAIMKDIDNLAFILIADGDSKTTAPIGNDKEDDIEELLDDDDEYDDECDYEDILDDEEDI